MAQTARWAVYVRAQHWWNPNERTWRFPLMNIYQYPNAFANNAVVSGSIHKQTSFAEETIGPACFISPVIENLAF